MTFHIETDFSEYLRDANAKNVCISRRPLFVDSDVNSNLDCSSDLHSHPSSDIRRQQSCRLNGHWLLLGGGGCCWPGFEFDLIRLFWLFEFDSFPRPSNLLQPRVCQYTKNRSTLVSQDSVCIWQQLLLAQRGPKKSQL